MQYFPNLKHGGQVDYTDIVFANKSVYKTNAVELLRRNGYSMHNHSIFEMKDLSSPPFTKFTTDPSRLIDYSTFATKTWRDIGWNFYEMASRVISFDSTDVSLEDYQKRLKDLSVDQLEMISASKEIVKKGANRKRPALYMFHYMITHEPFMFNADGSLNLQKPMDVRKRYLNTVTFANTVINDLVDLIGATHAGKDYIIIIQSDHGFKFEEFEPEFEKESCKILYAVYCSDRDHSYWHNKESSVNIFRIVFNKYFYTKFPLLPSKTHILRYRKQKDQ